MSYVYQSQFNSPNYTPGRQSLDEIIIHWWDAPENNPSYEGTINTLCAPGVSKSAHYVATGTGRRVACLVSPDDTAWHAGTNDPATNPNPHSIGIECDPRCRPEDYDVVAELIADIRSAFGELPLKRHSDFVNTRCPGNWDLNRLDALSRTKVSHDQWGAVTDLVQPTPTPQPDPKDQIILQLQTAVVELNNKLKVEQDKSTSLVMSVTDLTTRLSESNKANTSLQTALEVATASLKAKEDCVYVVPTQPVTTSHSDSFWTKLTYLIDGLIKKMKGNK